MKELDLTKHTKGSLELILGEADKLAQEVHKSLAENIKKSFLLFAIYLSLFSYSFTKVGQSELEHLILILGCITSSLLLRKNLVPNMIVFRGTKPSSLVVDYFDDFSGEEMEKEIIATQIQCYDSLLNQNEETITKMVNRFKRSIVAILIFAILFGATLLFRFASAECF